MHLFKEMPNKQWRTADPESTIRFYALRLREAGMIKSSPQRILGQGMISLLSGLAVLGGAPTAGRQG